MLFMTSSCSYHFLRENTLERVIKHLCAFLMEDRDLHHEWMEVLPYLHIIRSKNVSPSKPVPLAKETNKVLNVVFGGLNVVEFISRVTKESK